MMKTKPQPKPPLRQPQANQPAHSPVKVGSGQTYVNLQKSCYTGGFSNNTRGTRWPQ